MMNFKSFYFENHIPSICFSPSLQPLLSLTINRTSQGNTHENSPHCFNTFRFITVTGGGQRLCSGLQRGNVAAGNDFRRGSCRYERA
ncbi:hypothetical protein Dda3937_02323 [Dickeya dadantii 3937]|uniref:Uncharacterized protein n=1 Tax=Dickeya dadantii (strain 3937) TaxID=198628 RepID=E0SKZ9_DICD3|nr:hypothetical protein Dda3937_02323 [Dickeya dadantii 3937]